MPAGWGRPPDLLLAPGRRAATAVGSSATAPLSPPLLPSPPPLPAAPFSVPASEAPARHAYIRWPEGSMESVLQADETAVIRGIPRYFPAGTTVVTVPAAVRLLEGPGGHATRQGDEAEHRRSRSRSRRGSEDAMSSAPDRSGFAERWPSLSRCQEVARCISEALGDPVDGSGWSRRDFPETWCASFAERTTHSRLDGLCRDALIGYEYVRLIGTRADKKEKVMAIWRWVVGSPES